MNAGIRKQLVNGSLWAGSGKISSMVASFGAHVVLAKALMPAEYAFFFVAQSTVLLLVAASTLGMDVLVVKLVAYARQQNSIIDAKSAILRCGGYAAMWALVCVSLFIFVAEPLFASLLQMELTHEYLIIIAIWSFSAVIQRQLAESFRGLSDIQHATIFGGVRNSGILNSMGNLVVLVYLATSGTLDLSAALLSAALVSIVTVVFSASTLARSLPSSPSSQVLSEKTICTRDGRSMVAAAAPLWGTSIIATINSAGIAWLVAALVTPNDVALFAAAQRSVMLLVAPLTIVAAVLPPIVAQLYSSGEVRSLEKVVQMVALLVLVPSTLLFVGLVIFGKFALSIAFSHFYVASYPIMLLLCVGQVSNMAAGAWNIVLPMTGRGALLLSVSLLSTVLQFVSALLLGKHYGVLGIAAGICVSSMIANCCGVLVVHRALGVKTFANVAPGGWDALRASLGRRLSAS